MKERHALWDPKHPFYTRATARRREFEQVSEYLRSNFPELRNIDGGKALIIKFFTNDLCIVLTA